MWNTETIFSSEDLADGFPWCVFMEAEYTIYDEESAKEGIQKRREHVQYCIERLQEELSMIDRLASRLPIHIVNED